MKNSLARVAMQIFNTPLLINGDKLDTVLNAVGPRILAGEDYPIAQIEKRKIETPSDRPTFIGDGYLDENGIAVLPIVGSLVRRGSWLDSSSGLMSYDVIGQAVTQMLMDSRVKGLMLEIDSPGGEAGGCFDLVQGIRMMASETGKPIWAHANDMACSGGFAIACAADSIWLPQLGMVGSVGVVSAHVDVSEAEKKAGIKWTYITAGKYKVDGNPHEPLLDDVKSRLQADINTVYDLFADLVADGRGMSVDEVRKTEAATFIGQAAVDAGFADNVGTLDDAMIAFGNKLNSALAEEKPAVTNPTKLRRDIMSKRNISAKVEDPKVEDEIEIDEIETEEEEKEVPKIPEEIPDAKVEAEMERSLAMVSLGKKAAKLGVKFNVAKAIKSGMTLTAAREQVLNLAADIDEQKETIVVSSSHTIKDSNSHAEIKSGWDRAIAKQNAKFGIKAA